MTELCETFLPSNWDKDTLRQILAARMSLDQTFNSFGTDIVTANSLLDGGPHYLTKDHVKEQIFNNLTEDLREKLEEDATELAALNKLELQKWLNAISEIDIKMTKAVKRSAKRVALELEKEEKKKSRSLTGPSRTANTSANTSTNSDKCGTPYVQNKFKAHGKLPPLTEEERTLLYEHRGCFKCRRLYASHIQ